MIQFYALSIFVNIFTGLLLSEDGKSEKAGIMMKISELLQDKGTKFVLGLFAVLIGFFKILTPIQGDVPVIGDLFPALSGLAMGAVLLVDFFKTSPDVSSETIEKVDSVIARNGKYIGIVGILSGILHFLVPGVPII